MLQAYDAFVHSTEYLHIYDIPFLVVAIFILTMIVAHVKKSHDRKKELEKELKEKESNAWKATIY